MVSELPRTFNRLMADEVLEIGGRRFEILTGGGHSSEQVMLHCREGGFILSADQVLAKISPNISVEAINPNGDPLGAYLRSLRALKQTLLPETLALPGHNLPFVGLAGRIDELIAHHRTRCDAILKAVGGGETSAVALVPVVFGRPIDDPHQMSFAFGETLAHVNYLVRQKALAIRRGEDGESDGCRRRLSQVEGQTVKKRRIRRICFVFVSQTTLFRALNPCTQAEIMFNESDGPGSRSVFYMETSWPSPPRTPPPAAPGRLRTSRCSSRWRARSRLRRSPSR